MVPLMKYINTTHRCSNQFRSEQLVESGLNGCQSSYILYVCNNPGISQDQLAQIIYINKSNVTRQLAVLEEKGYVERKTSSSDKRFTKVYPTQKALDVLPRVRQVLQDWNEYITEGFTDEEKTVLMSLMERITEKAKLYCESSTHTMEKDQKQL